MAARFLMTMDLKSLAELRSKKEPLYIEAVSSDSKIRLDDITSENIIATVILTRVTYLTIDPSIYKKEYIDSLLSLVISCYVVIRGIPCLKLILEDSKDRFKVLHDWLKNILLVRNIVTNKDQSSNLVTIASQKYLNIPSAR